MLVRVNCTLCKSSGRVEIQVDKLPAWMDPRALAMRLMSKREGWSYRGGTIGKSVVDMVCVMHRDPAYFEADFDPSDAIPGTYQEDLAIEVDTAPDIPTLVP